MSFEALSCAMARVIINYHAYQTQGSALPVGNNDSGSLEQMLNCRRSEVHRVLRQKIDEATTGTNSSRRTLLEYMDFGISLAEQAEEANTPHEIQRCQTQLTQFIQNLQCLLMAGTMNYWSRSLSVSIDDDKSLSIYLLSYTAAHSKKLLVAFFDEVDLSPEVTEAVIQRNMTQRFEYHALLTHNKALKHELEDLNQAVMVLTAEFDALTKKKSKPAPERQRVGLGSHTEDEFGAEQEGFEYISLTHETEKQRLIAENEELAQSIEHAHKRMDVLEGLIKKCQSKQSQGFSLRSFSPLYSKDAKPVSQGKGSDEVSGVNRKMF
ncbi:MAG: hypothetical protein P1U39_03565 [Legionellaceae bacterium]|jgi:hypothetical protein|nr:hypothetical protein [Legionellaceae bacterium]